MKILFVTDIHGNTHLVEKLQERPDVLLIGGDMTNFGGVADARAVLEALRTRCGQLLCVAGNLDRPEVIGWLEAEGVSLHGRGVVVDGIGFFGCGGSNPTPMHTPTEFAEATIGSLLEQGLEQVAAAPAKVMVSHAPPFDTRTDRAFGTKHVGSTAVRSFIERFEPDLCLCGHIHESRALDAIGKTRICNPGAFASGHYAVVTVNGRVTCELTGLSLGTGDRVRAGVRTIGGKLFGLARHIGEQGVKRLKK